MCQLTFSNLGSADYNRIYLINQLVLNSNKINTDGTGTFTKQDGLWKTLLPAAKVINLGDMLNDHVNDNPVIAHVRAVSLTNTVKTVSSEFAHPFEYRNFILAHNGSLKLKSGDEHKFKNMIDTQIYGGLVEEYWDKNPDLSLEQAFTKIMDDYFHGKFAFLVYDKTTERFLAMRGRTADLYIAKVGLDEDNILGYVINTKQEDLVALTQFSRMCNLLYGGVRYKLFGPDELEKETIYELKEKDIEKIGEIKEDYATYYQTSFYQNNNHRTNWNDNPFDDKKYKFLAELIEATGLRFVELDMLVYIITGSPLVSITDQDLDMLKDIIFPGIKKSLPKDISALVKVWDSMVADFGLEDSYAEIQFPFFLNDLKELRRAKEELDKVFIEGGG